VGRAVINAFVAQSLFSPGEITMTENKQSQSTDRSKWDEFAILLLGGIIGALLERLLQPAPVPIVIALLVLATTFWLLSKNRLLGRLRDKLWPYIRYIQWGAFLTTGLVVGAISGPIVFPSSSQTPVTTDSPPPCPSIPQTLPTLAPITMSNLGGLQEIGRIDVSGVLAVALSGNDHWFAVATNRGVCLYEWETMRGSFGLFSSQVKVAAFSLDGNLMALGNRDGTIEVWDVRLSETQVRWKIPAHIAPVTSLAFSANGRWLASGSDDRTVLLWDALNGSPNFLLGQHSTPVKNLAFSFDNHLASGSNDGTIKLWDMQSKAIVTSTLEHRDAISALSFSPEGQLLASGSKDRTIQLWNIEGNKVRQLGGHTGWVLGVAFSPDGRLLVSGSEDKTIRLWEVDTGAQPRTLNGHTAGVYGVAFSPDGTVIVSGSGDGTVRLWGVVKQ
jgi:WD40 repeat protein